MLRLLVVLLVVALVVALVAYVLRRRRLASAPPPFWAIEERTHRGAVELRAVRRGQEPVLLERVPVDADDFELAIEEARARARSRVTALASR